MTNSVNFDSFFTEKTVDNNGVACCDINAGLANLYKYINTQLPNVQEEQLYLVRNHEIAYPDLVAYNSILGSQQYWWWILILNRLCDPLSELNENWVYAINSLSTINSIISGSNVAHESSVEERIGTVVELN